MRQIPSAEQSRCVGYRHRRGTVVPVLGVCLIGIFGFVALAVDLGMLAVSRTQSQNAADVAALVGTRTLNNKDGVSFNNLPAAIVAARNAVTSNPHLSTYFTASQVTRIEVGQYLYDDTSQTFRVNSWTNVTTNGTVTAPSGSWTAMRVTVSVAQPTYFMRVFGVTTMPTGARATAVYRPRDIAFVLDMTGSMAFSSTFNFNSRSHNPDTNVPRMGHYASIQSMLISTTNYANGSGEAIQRNNYTITTPGGPPIIRGFYFDPSNLSNPAVPAFPLSTRSDGSPNLVNAFHRWNPPESGGDPTNYIGPEYDWTGYDPTHNGTEPDPKGPVPAPASFGTMTDVAGIPYVGDRWRRGNGAINKTDTTWATSSPATRAALHAADLLGYTGSSPPTAGVNPAFSTNWLNFRDPVWELYGYDLDIVKYRAQRGSNGPLNPAVYLANNGGNVNNILVPPEDRFVGYSMGPGYWGKTFYIWPPDPRTPVGHPGDPVYVPGDWRRRYFLSPSGTPLNPQIDNNLTNAAGTIDGINEVIFNTGSSGMTLSLAANQVNYEAILRWIKSGPQVLPPNLRAGRVLYYSSIPNDVNTNIGSTQERLDKAFWRNYIDFVLGIGSYNAAANLYGPADSWSASSASITTADMTNYTFLWETVGLRPYMRYIDSPRRPRLHLWFGPLSMIHFLTRTGRGNWLPGTCTEAQCWQLKVAVNSVLDDIKNNHPNDFAGLVYFATSHHNGVREPIGQNFTRLKNALFYPRRGALLTNILNGDVTSEMRPYTNTTLDGYHAAEIPNAAGGTDPATGLAYAYNLLSSSTIPAAQAVGTGGGRRGAQKIIIFETDGVPNNYRVPNFVSRGFNSYYTLGNVVGAGNGDPTGMNHAYNVIRQIVKPMALVGTTTTVGPDSGLSLPNAPARVYPIAFGDLFDEVLSPDATFRPTALNFLVQCGTLGGTGGLPTEQIITGPYQQRIGRLRNTLERIFQGGVSVVLVE